MSILAYDDACDPIYNADGWLDGQNGGSGFGAWSLFDSLNISYNVGDSDSNDTIGGPGINCGTLPVLSWALTGTNGDPGQTAVAERDFPRNATTGDYFCLSFDNTSNLILGSPSQAVYLTNGLFTGSDLKTGFYPDSGTGTYMISDGDGILDTAMTYDSFGIQLQWFWVSASSYILTVTKLSDSSVYTSPTRNFEGVTPANHFVLMNAEFDGPQHTLYANTAVFADSVGGGGGCAGDPHFVDFQGRRFDFHATGNFLLWNSKNTKVTGKFALEDRVKYVPSWIGTTFITEITVNSQTFKAYDAVSVSKEELEAASGLNRGIAKSLDFVKGECLGGHIVPFDDGKIIISVFDSGYNLKHLNINIAVNHTVFQADGILGQTLVPKKNYKSNESFRL